MRTRVLLLASAALVCVAFEAGFLYYQRTVQEQLLQKLCEPGAIASSVILTREPVDEGFFSRRDRLTLKVGSSVFGDDADDAPLTVQFDVDASYGPLGLSGEVTPLATTASAQAILELLQGERPDIVARYELNPFTKALTVTVEASPFDLRMEDETGYLDTAWRVSSPERARWVIHFDSMAGARSVLAAKNVFVAYEDGVGGELNTEHHDVEIRHEFRQRSVGSERLWHIERGMSRVGSMSFSVHDHRGELAVRLRDVETDAHRRSTAESDMLNGDYEARAGVFDFHLRPEGAPAQGFSAKDLKVAMHADNVPTAIFEPIDDVALEHLLKKASSMRLRLDEFSFVADGLPASMKGYLTAHFGRHEERREACLEFQDEGFNVGWALEVEIPDAMLDAVRALAHGRVRGFDPVDFMTAAQRHGAPYHVLDFRGDLQSGATLNGLPAGF